MCEQVGPAFCPFLPRWPTEMKHADLVIKRILFLDGVPNLSDYDPIRVGRTAREQLDNDLALWK